MAKIVVEEGYNFNAIATLAGSKGVPMSYDPNLSVLEVSDVTKTALDKALQDYKADQPTADADFALAQVEANIDKAEVEFNEAKFLKAVVEFLVEQINELRSAQSLPPVSFDFRSAIKKVK